MAYHLSNESLTSISNYHIKSNLGWIGPLVSSKTTGNRFVLNINVTFARDNCCPRFVFLTKAMDNTLIQGGCYNISADTLRTFVFAEISNERHLEIDRSEVINPSPNTRCIQSESTQLYTCELLIHSYLHTLKYGSVYSYYPCFDRQSLDLTVNISLWTDTIPYQCKPLKKSSPCYEFYHRMYLPNVFGQLFIEDGDAIFSLANLLLSTKCHQHFKQFLCRAFYPECITNGSITPCRSMCFEVMHACSNISKYFLSTYLPQITELAFAVDYLCNLFSEDGLCYADNVTCKTPSQIEHGSLNHKGPSIVPVHSTATYKCNENYQLKGNSTIACEYSGEWSTPPICIPISNNRQIVILGTTFGTFAGLMLIVTLVIVIFRHEIVVILYAKFGIRFNKKKEEQREFDAFVAYSQEDIGFVKYQLLRPLERMKPKFKIYVHHRDFPVGNLITTNIINAIKQSRRTIIVLSQSFIDSEWCKFEVEQAHLQLMHDQSYKLLIIAIDDPKQLQNIPQLIQRYILTRTYLMRTDKLFWQKLLYQMPDKKTTDETEDEIIEEIEVHDTEDSHV